MTRDELLDAISDNIWRSDIDDLNHDPKRAALEALTTIEGLGFVIVPRVPDSDMYLRAGRSYGEALKCHGHMRPGDAFKAQWDGAIAGSPLYRDELNQPLDHGKSQSGDGDNPQQGGDAPA
jgi:hypothetical protein